ncbi:MAG: nucleoside triphosphate pyrophosphohydrolase [Candidatus Aenigmarchaeota archaeon]|nr:nucleoside triphosphate pyrophosphohydrolase [Candidatus Aenigmarchaeota archaeon]
MEKIYNKLVRDNVPGIIINDEKKPLLRMVDGDEFEEALKSKLREECDEFLDSNKTDELVDILEIIYKFASLKGISIEELEDLREEKRERRGGFDKGIFLEKVEE